MNQHTIEKIHEDLWIVDRIHRIVYTDSFGHSGWYWDENGPYVFPPVKDSFLDVLDEVIGESTRRRTMPTLP